MSEFSGISFELDASAQAFPGAGGRVAEPSAVAFGRFLRQLRERRGLSLAKVCEISRSTAEPFDKGTLSRLERGQQSPSIFRLGPLSRIYEISADALLERMELDREVDRLGGPDTDRLAYLELQRAGGASISRGNRKWDAYAYFRDSLRIAPQEKRVTAWINLVTAIRSLGMNALAIHELLELEASEALDAGERALVQERLSNCCRCLGEMTRAEKYADSAIAQSQAIGELRTLAHAYTARGRTAIDQEQWEIANDFLLKALATYREGIQKESRLLPSPSFEAQGLLMLAECSFQLRNASRMRRLTLTAKKMSEEHDLPLGLAYAELLLGYLDESTGHIEQALARWRRAAALATKFDNTRIVFTAEVEIFRQATEAGDVARARASRRRLERVVPWIPRHIPAYKRFKQLIDINAPRASREPEGEDHDEDPKVSAVGDGGDAGSGGDEPESRGGRVRGRSRSGRRSDRHQHLPSL